MRQSVLNILSVLSILVFCFNLRFIGVTSALFTDEATISDIQVSTGQWTTSGDGEDGDDGNGGPDSTPPVTTLTIDDGLVVEEKVLNGSFENGGSIAEWDEQGSTARLENDFEVIAYEGDWVARVGDTEDNSQEIWANVLSQTFNPGTKNLSFYYNFYTYDYLFDEPGFAAIINGQTVWDLFDSDLYFNLDGYPSTYADEPDYSSWNKVYLDLTRFGSNPLNLSFYSGNTEDEVNQSWVYLDRVTTLEVTANSSTKFYLNTEPGATSYYQVKKNNKPWQENDWQELSTDYFTLPGNNGDYTIYYYSVDENNNAEEPKSTQVHFDKKKPDKINDLEAEVLSESSVMLSWTVPADKGARTASYDIRFWKKEGNNCKVDGWETASQTGITPMPRFPDELQDFEINGLEGNTVYCFSIKSCDAALNCSNISNRAEAVTLARIDENQVGTQEVIINEIMWMGAKGKGADEWVELKNMTDQPINLYNWQIVKKKNDGTEECMYTFKADSILPADGYVVVSEYDSDHSAINIDCPSETCFVVGLGNKNDAEPPSSDFSLYNSKLQLKLYNGFWVESGVKLIDIADDWSGEPAAGQYDKDGGIYYSMERNEEPGDGRLAGNWHSCNDGSSTGLYWDSGRHEQGTPGHLNLSENQNKSVLGTELEFYLNQETQAVGFKVSGLSGFNKLDYEITYEPINREPQGIVGTIELNGEPELIKEDFILGTQSNEDWVYDTGMDKIYLKIIFSGNGIPDRTLEKEIDY